MTPIAKGTYVNSTHYSYTFLCEGCLLTDGTTFATNTTSGVLGCALDCRAVCEVEPLKYAKPPYFAGQL